MYNVNGWFKLLSHKSLLLFILVSWRSTLHISSLAAEISSALFTITPHGATSNQSFYALNDIFQRFLNKDNGQYLAFEENYNAVPLATFPAEMLLYYRCWCKFSPTQGRLWCCDYCTWKWKWQPTCFHNKISIILHKLYRLNTGWN